MSTNKLHKWFRYVNAEVFGGCLPKPVITLVALPDAYWGFCDEVAVGKYRLIISDRISEDAQIATLAHEMVHMYQFENGLSTSHNKEFRLWASRCKALLGMPVL